ncbi:MAG: homoserine dehydrogenase [Candidatus Hydrogenedentota bacterium]
MSLGVGIIGAGTVGSGVIEILTESASSIRDRTGVPVELVHVADTQPAALGMPGLKNARTSPDAETLIADSNVHIVCELIGGIEPAKTFILNALKAGKSVVTANKMLLAYHGPELCKAAADNGVELRYEAAVGGGIPIIKSLREGLAANTIKSVHGILNGTCNYILTRMIHEERELDEVLKQAQELGFAETPPDLDVEGHDTMHKCQIIASLCCSTEVDPADIPVEGITGVTRADIGYAREMGYVIKLLAMVRQVDEEVEAQVRPTLVPEDHLLASVRNEFNAVYVDSEHTGPTLYYGKGAGQMPTASAVVADIIDIGLRGAAPALPPFIYGPRRKVRGEDQLEGRYYIRLTTKDKPGVLGQVCTTLGNHGVSIASCIQHGHHVNGSVHVVLMTHATEQRGLTGALREIDSLGFITDPSHRMPVL